LLGGSNYKNNIWTRGFTIAFVFAVAVFETQNRSPENTLNFVTFSEFLTHPCVHHTTFVLSVPYRCGVVLIFWFWREIVFDVTYVLSVQYSCAVASVFCLWWEIVLKMRTRFYNIILLGYFIMIR
jgi:hypothetical protein